MKTAEEKKATEVARYKRYREAHPEEIRERVRLAQKKYRANNLEKSNACLRACALRRRYGITQAEFDALLAKQKGRCAICKVNKSPTVRKFHVDHDHATGKVRGILCHHCNLAIGQFKDDIGTIESALLYLKNSGAV